MSTFKDKLKLARLPEDTVQVCLRGNLAADFRELQQGLARIKEAPKGSGSMEGMGEAGVLEQMAALRADMQDSTQTFRLRALPRPEFRALAAQYPPLRTESGDLDITRVMDVRAGVHLESFLPVLLRRSVIEPEMDDEDWDALESVATDWQMEELQDKAWNLNRDEVKPVPFSLAELQKSRTIDTA